MIRSGDLPGAAAFSPLYTPASTAARGADATAGAAQLLAGELVGDSGPISSHVSPQARGLSVDQHAARVLGHLFEQG